jgi:hypothetical protein
MVRTQISWLYKVVKVKTEFLVTANFWRLKYCTLGPV